MNPQTQLISHIRTAIRQATLCVWLGLLAIACFCVFGTLASMAAFKDNNLVYYAFHYLPYVLIGVSIPLSLYHVFLLMRYRIVDFSILVMILATGLGLLGFTLIRLLVSGADMVFFMGLFLAMIAWFGMPFLFRVNFRKFLNFLEDEQTNAQTPPNPTHTAQ